MTIAQHKVVSLTYTLTLSNGEIADEATTAHPFTFIHGIGQTLEAFDKNLEGLKAGDEFSFSLGADDAYGESSEGNLVDLPKSVFSGPDVPPDLLTVGNMVPMQDQDGTPLNGVILSIDTDTVRMDFNHPLAGQALNFTGKIIEVRDATAEELDHGHVHGPGGHHH